MSVGRFGNCECCDHTQDGMAIVRAIVSAVGFLPWTHTDGTEPTVLYRRITRSETLTWTPNPTNDPSGGCSPPTYPPVQVTHSWTWEAQLDHLGGGLPVHVEVTSSCVSSNPVYEFTRDECSTPDDPGVTTCSGELGGTCFNSDHFGCTNHDWPAFDCFTHNSLGSPVEVFCPLPGEDPDFKRCFSAGGNAMILCSSPVETITDTVYTVNCTSPVCQTVITLSDPITVNELLAEAGALLGMVSLSSLPTTLPNGQTFRMITTEEAVDSALGGPQATDAINFLSLEKSPYALGSEFGDCILGSTCQTTANDGWTQGLGVPPPWDEVGPPNCFKRTEHDSIVQITPAGLTRPISWTLKDFSTTGTGGAFGTLGVRIRVDRMKSIWRLPEMNGEVRAPLSWDGPNNRWKAPDFADIGECVRNGPASPDIAPDIYIFEDDEWGHNYRCGEPAPTTDPGDCCA